MVPNLAINELVQRGLACIDHGDLPQAVEYFTQATHRDPTEVAGFINLGTVAFFLHDYQTAASAFAQALEIDPTQPQAHLGLAAINGTANRLDDAVRHAELALTMDRSASMFGNLGVLYRRQGDRDRALHAFEHAITREPEDWLHHFNRALELLVVGRFREGWDEFEYRLQSDPYRSCWGPVWDGSPTGHLMIQHEQGFGDTLQFCRYVEPASNRCEYLTFVVQPELFTLLQKSFAHNQKITVTTSVPQRFDHGLWVGSLLRLFQAGVQPIPTDAYITVGTPSRGDRLLERVGVAWAGRQRPDIDQRRSLPDALLARLMSVAGVEFVTLQQTDPRHDWAHTAAIIADLDLVISVDTAVAHLAGAMGKSVWLLNRWDTCWRWLLARDDSIWYPSMRIFRQPASNDWTSVIAVVVQELEQAVLAWPNSPT